ncbi:hypothetical protein HQ325_02845 [Rhodococcus sp. BP-349]|jgi:hypothetical protein|uniref:hypothetical protein n=1 Tax=Nocardiaceae TaxID=85025 RepID=UPI00050C6778|nr:MULTISPECIES: hypothetical protein [Rhodococcus]MBJ7323871.1 hypothetical protein [Rhodococcus sp. (in: high G+C Gram-positive bacteria)]MBW4781768.1 hypothetical protein [Rhodococcus fascians]MBY6537601.1 hypothetical protein [Rhodococcus sp. BP-363]MBY6541938.1 hypothetical protein [Rhodococcus sp. BP-369]MBY6561168.1 hypothetical protein [Rhodococcus sp. BP-370]
MGVKDWWDGPRQEAVPRTVAVGGILLSLAALVAGLTLPNSASFWISVCAALFLVGPGLVFSNLLIARWQNRRVERQALPWLVSICALLAQSFDTCRQVLAAAGVEHELPPTPNKCDVAALLSVASSYPELFWQTLSNSQPIPDSIRLTQDDLTLTHFGLVAQMLREASSLVPVSASSQVATFAEAWAESAGVTIVHHHREDGRAVLERKIGYPQIIDAARTAELSPTLVAHFDTQSLAELAVNQLLRTKRLLEVIAADLPTDVASSLQVFDVPQFDPAG